MLYVLIPPKWLEEQIPGIRSEQIDCSYEEAIELNESGYNLYWYPNYPSKLTEGFVKAGEVDKFEWVFLDLDLKHGAYTSKEEFLNLLISAKCPPTHIVDSGNGIHGYWKISDLDGMSFLKLSRRLARLYNTDLAVCQLKQLMRVFPSANTKENDNFKLCQSLVDSPYEYTCEQLNYWLPMLTPEDEVYCKQHYDKAHGLHETVKISDKLPVKFYHFIKSSAEAKSLWSDVQDDRSKADYRLAHLMFAEGFTKEEGLSVLVNCQKALSRAPVHRHNYALNIADKVWTFENNDASSLYLSESVADILKKTVSVKGDKFPCWEVYDGTHRGFRLTQVLGLIGASGSGKTTLALNYFYWFTKRNPDYIHVFVSLEQPQEEIAQRWCQITQGDDRLNGKVHVLGNYNDDGTYRNLSLFEVEDYIISLEKRLNAKVGCVVIDHIGVLKKVNKDGENQGLIDICHNMKAFAKRTNTFLVMQSQTSRPKGGIGDVELDKDAAYGTSMFENYCDFVVTTWQPLKRVYDIAPHMTCSAFKYCKIRHKNVRKDNIKEDVVHALMFNPETELLTEMTQSDEIAFNHFSSMANTLRNKDRKREPTKLTKINWVGKSDNTEMPNAKNKHH